MPVDQLPCIGCRGVVEFSNELYRYCEPCRTSRYCCLCQDGTVGVFEVSSYSSQLVCGNAHDHIATQRELRYRNTRNYIPRAQTPPQQGADWTPMPGSTEVIVARTTPTRQMPSAVPPPTPMPVLPPAQPIALIVEHAPPDGVPLGSVDHYRQMQARLTSIFRHQHGYTALEFADQLVRADELLQEEAPDDENTFPHTRTRRRL